MAKRTNTLTRFVENVLDDTNDLVGDMLDRAKDVENKLMGTVADMVDDERTSASVSDVASLQSALTESTAKVNQLADRRLAGLKA